MYNVPASNFMKIVGLFMTTSQSPACMGWTGREE